MAVEFVGEVKAHEVWDRRWEVLTGATKGRDGDIRAGMSWGTTGADVVDRLLPAFDTHTSIPYGVVNLKEM